MRKVERLKEDGALNLSYINWPKPKREGTWTGNFV
jgi:hypothetical protein